MNFLIKSALLLFSLLICSSPQAMAALSYTHLDDGNGSGGSSTTTVTTNSITVAANELVIIVFAGEKYGDGTSQSVSVSSVVYNGTGSPSLTNIATQKFTQVIGGPIQQAYVVSAYYFIPTGSSSGTITITFSTDVSNNSWSTFYFTGENTLSPIVQSIPVGGCSSSNCTSLTASLGNPITSNDATVAAFANAGLSVGGAITATASYNTIDNISSHQYLLSEYLITGTQSPSATWEASYAGGLAFEVAVAGSAAPKNSLFFGTDF